MTHDRLPWLSARGTQLVREDGSPLLLRGFGLGGWLLPEGYMWRMHPAVDRPRRMEALIAATCGQDWADSFWRQYRQSFITEADIRSIAAAGFNSVRLPFNSRTLFKTDGEAVSFDDETISLIDNCIGWCKAAGIYLVLDMHGAPGGQTGANIDDSARDLAELFTEDVQQDQCVRMWALLAGRYADESTVAGYDLLNEPLAPPSTALAPRVLPLYRRIRDAIRKVDSRHMIILEGTRWASDLGIFDELGPGDFDDNWLLQFHKYWNAPYAESIRHFLDARQRLQVPLYMGEGGENNLDWYATAFPMLETLDISWNFWTYKKMDCHNSPVSFSRPGNWPPAPHADGRTVVLSDQAASRQQWTDFLSAIESGSTANPAVFRALKRQAPLGLPAEGFDSARLLHPRQPGAELRPDSQASILFLDGHSGQPDYQRMAGEDQAADQQLCVALQAGESLSYTVSGGDSPDCRLRLSLENREDCRLLILLDDAPVADLKPAGQGTPAFRFVDAGELTLPPGRHKLSVAVEAGSLRLHRLEIR